MQRRRRCQVCLCWFHPNPRAGNRQRVCSRASCQQERHRRACARWHRHNPGYDRERRLRERLHSSEPASPKQVAAAAVDPLRQIDWATAQCVAGLEAAVIVEMTGQAVVQWVRDAVAGKAIVITAETPKVTKQTARDAVPSQVPEIVSKNPKVSSAMPRDDIASASPPT